MNWPPLPLTELFVRGGGGDKSGFSCPVLEGQARGFGVVPGLTNGVFFCRDAKVPSLNDRLGAQRLRRGGKAFGVDLNQPMQPGAGYTQEDFSHPEFCRACGTHVPRSYLAASGGLCMNCLRNLQQMHPPGPMYRAPRTPFFRSSGFAALVVGLVAVSLLVWGAWKYLKISPTVRHGGMLPGASSELSQSQGSLVNDPVDDATDAQLRTMASQEMNDAFGPDTVNPGDVDTQAIRNKLTNQTTYLAGGSFDCLVARDREHVQWEVDYVKDEQGQWRLLKKEAFYKTDDGAAQFDFDQKKFIHLIH